MAAPGPRDDKDSIKRALSTADKPPQQGLSSTQRVVVDPAVGKIFQAAPYDAPVTEKGFKQPNGILDDETREFERYHRASTLNWTGTLAFVLYLLCLVFYLWVRITKTLDLGGYLWYGIIVLAVEMLGATTVILYGINLLRSPVVTFHIEEDPENPGRPRTKHPYHVRVLVPCYKESLDILRRTVMAAYDATLPEGCQRTIYLCDDGKDPKKRAWVDSLGPEVVYVSGRKRPPGEMNGKSGNLNNVCSQLYPAGTRVPSTELLCIFDADQVASREFYLKTLPLFDSGDDIAMVLSPQCFHNLDLHSDIFNHSNVHFWEYMQPGYDAIGFISCTGTNFLVRSTAMLEVGGSPTWTLTEDYALGMELKKYGWNCRYVQEYLAIGEAPDQIRNCYQQRSRWCKGHFQIIFNREHCPLLQRRLSTFMRIYYSSGVWSYIVCFIATPVFILLPVVTIWFGVFPIVVSWWTALGLSVYYGATQLVLYYVRSFKHLEALWFANVANTIMWFTYLKAFWRAFTAAICKKDLTFKTTLKGSSLLANSYIRDLWMPMLCFVLLLASLIAGLVQLFSGPTVSSPLAISVMWCVYTMIPELLVIYYAMVSKGKTLQYVCRFCLLLSFFTGIGAVALMWALYPKSFDLTSVLANSNFFYRAQRVGVLPLDNGVGYRSNALTYETGPNGRDMTGGWLNGGVAGNLKMTMPTAFTVSLLAWGLLDFPDGYNRANATLQAQSNVKWGADYLLKTVVYDRNASTAGVSINGSAPVTNVTGLIYQMGNQTLDSAFWGRPEDLSMDRPFFLTKGVPADLGGALVGALASAALVFKASNPAYYVTLLSTARDVYLQASDADVSTSLYGASIILKPCLSPFAKNAALNTTAAPCMTYQQQLNGSAIPMYNGTSASDKMAWAAAWMYKATGDPAYQQDVTSYYMDAVSGTTGNPTSSLLYDWDHYYWAVNVLMAKLTNLGSFHERSQYFMRMWICGINQIVQYTPRGRAWNQYNGALGSTANAAFLAATYAKFERPSVPSLASRYTCWTLAQIRYLLGESGTAYVVGQGGGPTHAANQAASCPPAPLPCDAVTALLNPQPNPYSVAGALVQGGVFTDTFNDVRALNDTQVQIDSNAGFQSALAGLVEAPGSWEECLQGYGLLVKDKTVCQAVS